MDMDIKCAQCFLRLLAHQTPVDHRQSEDPTDRLASQKHVCPNVEIIRQRKILVNRFDSAVARLVRIIELYLFSFVSKTASIRVMDSGDDFDKGGFSRSVISGQGQNFARMKGQRDVFQCMDASESF